MNRLYCSSRQAGVTLLESMLVLVLISTIIVMSMRYYQSASNSTQATGAVAALQSVAGDIERYGAANASVASFAASNISNSTSPLGAVSISGTPTSSAVTVAFATIPTANGQICTTIRNSLTSSKWTALSSACSQFTYTYVSTGY